MNRLTIVVSYSDSGRLPIAILIVEW